MTVTYQIGNINKEFVYINLYTHTYAYIYTYTYICPQIEILEFTI